MGVGLLGRVESLKNNEEEEEEEGEWGLFFKRQLFVFAIWDMKGRGRM